MTTSERKAYDRRRYIENREQICEASRRWRVANTERRRAADRKRYLANRERLLAGNRRWQAENLEGVRGISRRTQARRRAIQVQSRHVRYTETDLDLIFLSQNGLCLYCARPIARWHNSTHIDHMVPLSRGGSDAPGNIAFACAACNRRKRAKTAEEFAA